jgi:hypothetical protein
MCYFVLNDKICMLTATAINIKKILIKTIFTKQIAEIKIVTHKVVIEIILTFLLMALVAIKSCRYFPKILWFKSQLCHLLELLENKNKASSRKGVVGSTGRKIPIIPSTTNKKPSIINTFFKPIYFI